MTQPGETDGMTAADHLEALLANAGERVCDYVVVNNQPPSRLLAAYAQEGQVPGRARCRANHRAGLHAGRAPVISETETVRHDPTLLANVVLGVVDRMVAERATLVKPGKRLSPFGAASEPATENTPRRYWPGGSCRSVRIERQRVCPARSSRST